MTSKVEAKSPKHPAKFNEPILVEIAGQLWRHAGEDSGLLHVHDPFAGTGRVHLLQDRMPDFVVTSGMEIEPEWAGMHSGTVCGDSTVEDLPDGTEWVVTSPCYGNRMADTLLTKGRRDYTYSGHNAGLGRKLADNNAGAMQWGDTYRDLHETVYGRIEECSTVRGLTLNIKDHIRQGKPQGVDLWHIATLCSHGWVMAEHQPVQTQGQRDGTNKGKLIDTHEWVITFTRKVNQ